MNISKKRILFAMKECDGEAPDLESTNPAELMAAILLNPEWAREEVKE